MNTARLCVKGRSLCPVTVGRTTGTNQKSREPRSKIKEDGSALGKVGEAANSLLLAWDVRQNQTCVDATRFHIHLYF